MAFLVFLNEAQNVDPDPLAFAVCGYKVFSYTVENSKCWGDEGHLTGSASQMTSSSQILIEESNRPGRYSQEFTVNQHL